MIYQVVVVCETSKMRESVYRALADMNENDGFKFKLFRSEIGHLGELDALEEGQ